MGKEILDFEKKKVLALVIDPSTYEIRNLHHIKINDHSIPVRVCVVIAPNEHVNPVKIDYDWKMACVRNR